MGRLGYIALGLLTTGAGLYFLNNRDYQPDLNSNTQANRQSSNSHVVSVPLEKEPQNYINQEKAPQETQPEQYSNVQGSLESRLYTSLVEEFAGNLDATLHYGSEDRFKGNLVLGLRDIPADAAVQQYQSKLESLTGQERQDLINRYGAVVDFLKGKGSATLDSLASSKGYLGIDSTADQIWPKVKGSLQNSVIGDMFSDVIDNDFLPQEKLDRFIIHSNTYCTQAGISSPNLETKIREYQSQMKYCDDIQKRMNSGQEVTDADRKRMESYVRTLGEIQDEFGRITSREKNQEKLRGEIISSLNEINPLYGFAMEVVGIQ